MNLWTNDDIKKILLRLDSDNLPFKKYTLLQENGEIELIGHGGSSNVYAAFSRGNHKKQCAIKVIGFSNQTADSEFFNEAIEVQKEIGDYQDYVVRIYDHCELWITFDIHDNILSVSKDKPADHLKTVIKLQFIVMERVIPVIERTKAGNIKMMPEALGRSDEKEVLKLAYDIGLALQRAHNKNILHRDVKLENVFYSEKKNQYKLGDFGIAKKTNDGFASTVAFTKGYAAPEVRGTPDNDRYDKTADIYSYGMMLFVLMNGLKFPDSNTYNVNSSLQYSKGYILPEPENDISDALYFILIKACMYDPDQRYQSMDEVILDIEKVMYGDSIGYKKEHKSISLAMGTILLFVGVIAWRITGSQDLSPHLSLWQAVFSICGLGKGIFRLLKKNVTLLNTVMIALGIYMMISGGLSLVSIVVIILMIVSSGAFSGYMGGSLLLLQSMSLLQTMSTIDWNGYEKYNWVAVSVTTLAIVLLYQYAILSLEDRKTVKLFYGKGLYWIVICLFYFELFIIDSNGLDRFARTISLLFGQSASEFLWSVNWEMVGITGLLFCLLWIGREKIMQLLEKKDI